MNGRIVTVTGDITADSLEYCQSHEHILLRKGHSYEVNHALCMDDPAKSLRELQDYYKAGGRSIVDAQPVGCGRMAEELRDISEASRVKIIASTGFHKLLFYPEDHWIRKCGAEELAELWTAELEDGMYEDGDQSFPQEKTNIRAGQIKTALDWQGVTGRYRVLFAAAFRTAKETGAPIMVHVEQGSDPRKLIGVAKEAHIPAEQMIFCHMDRAVPDLRIHREIARTGAYLEYDTIGRWKYHSDREEIKILQGMIGKGFEDRLLFSLDTTALRLGAYDGGEITLCYILDHFISMMSEAGISDTVIGKISQENPSRAFVQRRT